MKFSPEVIDRCVRRWWSSPARWPVLGVAAVGLLALVVWVFPPLLAETDWTMSRAERLKAVSDARGSLLQALGGFVVVVGVIVSALTLRLNTRKHADEREADRLRLEQSERGQITERFTRAIDQLGHDTIDVRLGGIYALEKIANDSDADRETIFEVLAAFIREHTTVPASQSGPIASDNREPRPPGDVQAAITVLGRRLVHATDRTINLGGTNLAGVNLPRSSLANSHLRDSNLFDANLQQADLSRGDLTDAYLLGANLTEANLTGAILQNTVLAGAYLEDANLADAYLGGADLRFASLSGAILSGANVSQADFTGANLAGAYFTDAILIGAVFDGADLTSADFTGATIPSGTFDPLNQAVSFTRAVFGNTTLPDGTVTDTGF